MPWVRGPPVRATPSPRRPVTLPPSCALLVGTVCAAVHEQLGREKPGERVNKCTTAKGGPCRAPLMVWYGIGPHPGLRAPRGLGAEGCLNGRARHSRGSRHH